MRLPHSWRGRKARKASFCLDSTVLKCSAGSHPLSHPARCRSHQADVADVLAYRSTEAILELIAATGTTGILRVKAFIRLYNETKSKNAKKLGLPSRLAKREGIFVRP